MQPGTYAVTLLTFSRALSPSAFGLLCIRSSSSVQQGQQKRLRCFHPDSFSPGRLAAAAVGLVSRRAGFRGQKCNRGHVGTSARITGVEEGDA